MVTMVLRVDISPALEQGAKWLSSLSYGVFISQKGLAVLTLSLSVAC